MKAAGDNNVQGGPWTAGCVGPDTLIVKGQPVSLASKVGVLTVMHGALQSAIGTVDAALSAEKAYELELRNLSAGH